MVLFSQFFEDLIFPTRCLICQTDGMLLCNNCLHTLQHAPRHCPFCSTPNTKGATCMACHKTRFLFSAHSVYAYDDQRVKKIIERIKFHGEFAYLRPLTNDITDIISEMCDWMSVDAIIPIPSKKESFLQRGFNPAECLARICAQAFRKPIHHALTIQTERVQHTRTRNERLRGLSTFFRSKALAKSIRHAMVIDDILTTGGTLEAAAFALRNAGIERVSGFTLARQEKFIP